MHIAHPSVDLILDKTGRGICQSDAGRNFIADAVNSTRQIARIIAARFLFENNRRIHVDLHGVRVHGSD